MRLSEKQILFVLAAAVLPLSLVGFWLLREAERELTERISSEQRAVASAAAEGAASQVMAAINALATSAVVIDWRSATRDEVQGGLKLLYAQSALVSAVGLVDPQKPGEAPPLIFDLEGHPRFEFAAEKPLAGWFPFESLGSRGERGQVAISPANDTRLPVAIQVTGADAQAAFVVAQLSLNGLAEQLKARASPAVGELSLVDQGGHVVAASSSAPFPPGRVALLKSGAEQGRTEDAERVAIARVPERLGLFAVVALPEEVALAPVQALRRTVLLGIGATLGLLVLAAVIFTRALNRRLAGVGQAALAYGRGELATRLDVGGSDELSDLASTFNQMGVELEASRAKLTRWNDELKAKVDEAVADLRAAQAQLLEAQKLAAIGQLGAGVAHEINNPLCGILGNAQLMMLDRTDQDPDFELLQKIEESAKRCRDITQNLLRFSQSQGVGAQRQIDLNAVVRSTLAFEQPRFDEAGDTVTAQLHVAPLEVLGDPEQLAQMLSALLSNARTAMLKTPEKKLAVSTRLAESGVELEVTDTGKGIAPEALPRVFEPFFTTKDVWSNIGLGLSVAYRVVTEHQGHIEVDSRPGHGARFTVKLPRFDPLKAARAATQPTEQLQVGGQGVGIVK